MHKGYKTVNAKQSCGSTEKLYLYQCQGTMLWSSTLQPRVVSAVPVRPNCKMYLMHVGVLSPL